MIRTPFSFIPLFLLAATASAQMPPEPKYRLVLQTPPATEVNSVTVSPDGSLIASAAGEGGVRLYDARDGRLLRVLGDVGDRCVVFSPDGKTLTAAGFHMDKLVSLWDVASGKRLRTFAGQTEWEADATAISPDGKLLASTATDKQILVWEIATGKLKLQLKNQPARMAALAFSPDSATLAAGGGDRSVHLWDCATGKLRTSFKGQSDWICALAYSPDGKTLASGSCEWESHRGHNWPRPPYRGVEQCEWIVWDVASGKAVQKHRDQGRLLSVAFTAEGKSLVCGIGREVRLFAVGSESPAKVIATHDGDVTSVAVSPDGKWVVSGSHDQSVKFTDLGSAQVRWRALGTTDQVNSVALSADGSLLVTGSSDGRFARGLVKAGAKEIGPGAVRLWDARTGRMLRRLGKGGNQVMAVTISADGKCVVAGSGTAGGKGSVDLWDAATGSAVWSANDDAKEVLCVAFSRDGSVIASGGADGRVTIRDAKSGVVIRTLGDHAGGASAVVFSPDGNTLFCGQAFGGTRVWNVRTGQLIATYRGPESQSEFFTVDRRLNAIGLTRDGGTLAVCASSVNNEYTSALQFWDVRTGKMVRDFSEEKIHGRPMALSPDGSIIATGGKSVQLWDARTGKPLRQLYGDLKRTQSIVFSADGRLIVEGGSYGTTNLWEVSSGRHLATLFTFAEGKSAERDGWLAYTPDGFYDGSAGVERVLAWRIGDQLETVKELGAELHKPNRVAAALATNP